MSAVRRKSNFDDGAPANRHLAAGPSQSVAGMQVNSRRSSVASVSDDPPPPPPPTHLSLPTAATNNRQQAWGSPNNFSDTQGNLGNSVNVPPEIRDMSPEQVEQEIDKLRVIVWKRCTGLAVGLALLAISFWAAYVWAAGMVLYLIVMVGVAWKHFKTSELLLYGTCCCTPINAINYFYMALFPLIFLSGISVVTSLVAASEHDGALSRVFAAVCVLASLAVGVTAISLVPAMRRLNQMCWHRYGPQMGSDMQPRQVAVGGGGDQNPHHQGMAAVPAPESASLYSSANPPPNQPVIQQGLPVGGLGGGGGGGNSQYNPASYEQQGGYHHHQQQMTRTSSFERKPGTGFHPNHFHPAPPASQGGQGGFYGRGGTEAATHPAPPGQGGQVHYHHQSPGYQHQQVYPAAQPVGGGFSPSSAGEDIRLSPANHHQEVGHHHHQSSGGGVTHSDDVEIQFRQPSVSPTSSPSQQNLLH